MVNKKLLIVFFSSFVCLLGNAKDVIVSGKTKSFTHSGHEKIWKEFQKRLKRKKSISNDIDNTYFYLLNDQTFNNRRKEILRKIYGKELELHLKLKKMQKKWRDAKKGKF